MSSKPELYKDKIEVSLDGRQIFYLFFGGAVIVGMVFVLGVMVGRRVEARGHVDRAKTQAHADPLAALDRLEGSGGLSFHGTLTGTDAPSSVEKTIAAAAAARKSEPVGKPAAVAKPDSEAVAKKPDEKLADKSDEKKLKSDEPKTEPKTESKAEKKKTDESAKSEEPKTEKKLAKTDESAKSDKSDKAEPKTEAKTDAKAEPKSEAKTESKTRYTLQLSSFQDKGEAETFLSSMKSAGHQAYLTEADVSGKGTFYRVRLGTFRSLESANDAKADFERSSKKSASIMKL